MLTVACGTATPPLPEPSPLAIATVVGSPTPNLPPSPASTRLPATAVATPVPTPAPVFANDVVALGKLVWATTIDPGANAPATTVTSFATTDRIIYAVVPVYRITRGTTLKATWQYNNTSLTGFDQTLAAAADDGAVWVEFHLSLNSDTPWPDGTYEIAITASNTPAITAEVEVREPGH